jgi:hypothetical protein
LYSGPFTGQPPADGGDASCLTGQPDPVGAFSPSLCLTGQPVAGWSGVLDFDEEDPIVAEIDLVYSESANCVM